MKTKRLLLALSVLMLALTGCTVTSMKMNGVRIGMTKSQVVELLGQPDSTSAQANIEYLTYFLSTEGNGRDQPYMVRLVDARVESFGRFIQLLDVYNRPVGGAQTLGIGAVMPYAMNTDVVTQLQQLKSLRDQGVLSEEEFERVKQRVLGEHD